MEWVMKSEGLRRDPGIEVKHVRNEEEAIKQKERAETSMFRSPARCLWLLTPNAFVQRSISPLARSQFIQPQTVAPSF